MQQPSPTSIDRTLKLPRARVVKREQCADDLFKLWLKPDMPFPAFKPGQYCTIGVNGIERAYSIVSAPHEEWLELFVELVPGGELTPLLWNLQTDDTVSIRPRAKGVFVRSPEFQSHFMVSTVTGVVPFVGILRDYFHKGETGHKFYVIEGASYPGEFGYDDELAEMAGDHPDHVRFLYNYGYALKELDRPALAEVCLRASIAADTSSSSETAHPAAKQAKSLLAELLEESDSAVEGTSAALPTGDGAPD